jgi:hypothetical protein
MNESAKSPSKEFFGVINEMLPILDTALVENLENQKTKTKSLLQRVYLLLKKNHCPVGRKIF